MIGQSILRNADGLVVLFVSVAAGIRIGHVFSPGWTGGETGQLLGCIVGGVAAIWLRAWPAALINVAMAVFSGAELAAHATYGFERIQGAVMHFTALFASVAGATLGVLLGFWASTLRGGLTGPQTRIGFGLGDGRLRGAAALAPLPAGGPVTKATPTR
jgi:hypothetical protein